MPVSTAVKSRNPLSLYSAANNASVLYSRISARSYMSTMSRDSLYSTYLDYAGIPFPFPTPMSAAILAAILEFTFSRYFFHPENDFNGFLESRTLTQKPR